MIFPKPELTGKDNTHVPPYSPLHASIEMTSGEAYKAHRNMLLDCLQGLLTDSDIIIPNKENILLLTHDSQHNEVMFAINHGRPLSMHANDVCVLINTAIINLLNCIEFKTLADECNVVINEVKESIDTELLPPHLNLPVRGNSTINPSHEANGLTATFNMLIDVLRFNIDVPNSDELIAKLTNQRNKLHYETTKHMASNYY